MIRGTQHQSFRLLVLTAAETIRDDPDRDVLPLFEETVSLSTRKVTRGRVRIATRTEEVGHVLPAILALIASVTSAMTRQKSTWAVGRTMNR